MARRNDLDEFQDSYDAGYDYACDNWADMAEVTRSELEGVSSDIGCDFPDMAYEGMLDALKDKAVAIGHQTLRKKRVKK